MKKNKTVTTDNYNMITQKIDLHSNTVWQSIHTFILLSQLGQAIDLVSVTNLFYNGLFIWVW